jgi:predicted nucleic acid-binding protein
VIVIDASALVEVLLHSPQARAIEARFLNVPAEIKAPYLIDIEVAHAVRRLTALGRVGEREGGDALANLARFPLVRYPHEMLLPRIWGLRHSLTAYDATYVALAEALNAPLVTRDRRLAAATGHRAMIEVI